MMRTMLVINLAVQERFANGTQGRVMFWHPTTCTKKKSLYSSNPELLARFVKDSALNKREMLPGLRVCQYFWFASNVETHVTYKSRSLDLDHVDVTARQETLTACQGQPVLVQLPLVPSYALTVHKTQALSIKHAVRGCLEGVSPSADAPIGVPVVPK